MSKSNNLGDSKYPEFFEPKPVTHTKLENNKSSPLCIPVRRKPILRRIPGYYFPIVSVLGKRTVEEAFGRGMNDKERYGQEIAPDFFKFNRGHNAFPSYTSTGTINSKNSRETQINYWREKYMSKC